MKSTETRVCTAMLVEEALRAVEPEDALVPDVRLDVEALLAGEPEAYELLRRDVVALAARAARTTAGG